MDNAFKSALVVGGIESFKRLSARCIMAFVYSQPLVRDVKRLIGPFSPMRPDLRWTMQEHQSWPHEIF